VGLLRQAKRVELGFFDKRNE